MGTLNINTKKRLTIEDMRSIAESRGGKCLSVKYLSNKTKLLWQCDKGHEWLARPDGVKNSGYWCLECAGKQLGTLQEMQAIATEHGGKCLSESYVNSSTNLLWQCEKRHEWQSTPHRVKRGQWCAICSGKTMLTLEQMQAVAESRGGKCLSIDYVSNKGKLLWQCKNGHEWWAPATRVKRGAWCIICANRSLGTIEEMQVLAESRGGKCVSTNYVNAESKLLWRCFQGHEWRATPITIKHQGSWCPDCSAGTGEKICRAYFEQLFNAPFTKSRPDWLRNSRGNRMELDGFNDNIKLAFEHQGKQHFEVTHTYVTNDQELAQRIADDTLKTELCNQRGVTLLHIPEIPSLLPLRQIKQYIKKQCEDLGVILPLDFDEKTINMDGVYNHSYLQDIQAIAESHGGRCLSEGIILSSEKVNLRCSKGHEWSAVASHIKMGIWCLECSGSLTLTIEEMRRVAESRGGKCLSKNYINSKTKLLWKCKEGHEWWATGEQQRHGQPGAGDGNRGI